MRLRSPLVRALLVVGVLAALLPVSAASAQPMVTIMQIQGEAHTSPFEGTEVTTSGIVTATAFNGYYVQDPVGDDMAATSDAIFVFDFRRPFPSVGTEVTMTDTVTEFVPGGCGTGNLSTTQMSVPVLTIESTGNPLPSPTVIGTGGRIPPNVITISEGETPSNDQPSFCQGGGNPSSVYNPAIDGLDFYESLEAMLVTVDEPVAVSATRTFNSFSSEFFTLPSDGAYAAPDDVRTARGGINLAAEADGYGDTNPERVQIQLDGTLFPDPVPNVKVGDHLGDITGVVGYSFGNFEVNALGAFAIDPSTIGPETTSLNPLKREVTVASYNVLNLASPLAGGGSDPDAAQRENLANQIANNLGTPDVIALQEIQDNNGTDGGAANTETDATVTLQALVDAISAAGGPDYSFFDVAPDPNTSGGVPGGNIRNAFLYNADRVKLVDFVSLTPDVLADIGVSNPDAFSGTRNPLLATFKFRGKEFTVINNHLTSRFGSTPIFGGPQLFFQAGEDEREAQTGALNEVVDVLVAGGKGNPIHASKAGRIMVVGDLNTFEFTDDLTEILPGTGPDRVLTNLVVSDDAVQLDDNVYSFIFDGNSQQLDHFFVTDNVLGTAEFDIVHVNVDFPRIDASFGSDHEPLVGRFGLNG